LNGLSQRPDHHIAHCIEIAQIVDYVESQQPPILELLQMELARKRTADGMGVSRARSVARSVAAGPRASATPPFAVSHVELPQVQKPLHPQNPQIRQT
jgi:hypothetical protein